MTPSSVFLVAGTLLAVGGLLGVRNSARARRQGSPWRGDALAAVALAAYGALTSMGVVFNGTAIGAAIVWVVAAAVWTGLWIAHRERRVTSR